MLRVWRRHLTRLLLIIAVLVTAGPPHALAQNAELSELMKQVMQLKEEGRYKEAIPIEQKALAVAENTLGAEHATTLINVKFLGLLYIR